MENNKFIANILLLMFNLAILNAGCRDSNNDSNEIMDGSVVCVQVDPLEKIFRQQTDYVEINNPIAIAKGEVASFQLIVSSPHLIQTLKIEAGDLVMGANRISVNVKSFVGYVHVSPDENIGYGAASDQIIPEDGYYPDPLPETTTKGVRSKTNQPIWITYSIPHNAAAGTYTADIVLIGEAQGKKFSISKKVSVEVYNVALPAQTLLVTHWFSSVDALACMNNNQSVTVFSDTYFQLMKILVNKARDYGQNVFQINRVAIKYSLTGNTYTFDFSRFDRLIELFLNEGNAKRIYGSHLARRFDEAGAGWTGPFGVYVPTPDNSQIGATFNLLPIDDPRTQNFLSQFLPALHNHLLTKGWDKIYMQHLADEPLSENVASYNEIASYVKSVAPQIRLMDAICTPQAATLIDVPVPRIDVLHENYDYFRQVQASGKELWYYHCDVPKWEYVNRFIELPLIKTRLAFWINARYHVTGFLHWAFQTWTGSGVTSENVDWGPTVPGDRWIIYPGNKKVYSSIRYEALRDGINDYELLLALEKKNPAKAKELIESIVKDFNSYDTDIATFRAIRVKLLEALNNQ
jgi:hypothetical protein